MKTDVSRLLIPLHCLTRVVGHASPGQSKTWRRRHGDMRGGEGKVGGRRPGSFVTQHFRPIKSNVAVNSCHLEDSPWFVTWILLRLKVEGLHGIVDTERTGEKFEEFWKIYCLIVEHLVRVSPRFELFICFWRVENFFWGVIGKFNLLSK